MSRHRHLPSTLALAWVLAACAPAPAPQRADVLAPLAAVALGSDAAGARLVFAADGSAFAAVASDGAVRVFEAGDGTPLATLVHPDPARLAASQLALAAGGTHLVVAGDRLEILELASGEHVVDEDGGDYRAPALSLDGATLALVQVRRELLDGDEDEYLEHRELQVHALRDGEQVHAWPLADDSAPGYGIETSHETIVHAPDGRFVFLIESRGEVSGERGSDLLDVEVYDRVAGTRLDAWRESVGGPLAAHARVVDEHETMLLSGFVGGVAVAPSHQAFAVFTELGGVLVWDLEAFADAPHSGAAVELDALTLDEDEAFEDGTRLVAFAADARSLSLGTTRQLAVLDRVAQRRELAPVPALGDGQRPSALIGARWLLIETPFGDQRRTELWSRATGEPLGCLTRFTDAAVFAFSPDASRLVRVRMDGTLELWDGAALDDPRIATVLACD